MHICSCMEVVTKGEETGSSGRKTMALIRASVGWHETIEQCEIRGLCPRMVFDFVSGACFLD